MPQKSKIRTAPPGKSSRIDPVRELVGVLTDSEVAARAGVTSSAVHQYRQRHGIAPALPQGTTRRSLERRRAAEGRGEASGSADAVEARIAKFAAQVGTAGDDVIARRANVKVSQVAAYRERAGIPAPAATAATTDRRRSKIDGFRDLVGILTDPEVATMAGVTRTAVQMYRKKHGIGPAGPPGDPAAARSRAPSAHVDRQQVPVASGGQSFAWKITLAAHGGQVVRIAVARDAASACTRAGVVGEVLQVERLAEAIQ